MWEQDQEERRKMESYHRMETGTEEKAINT